MSTTRRALVLRALALLILTVATMASLFTAYTGVHSQAAPVRERTAPAILDVTAAQNALLQSFDAVRDSGTGELVSTGGGYRVQIAVANQSLARAAGAAVGGEPGLRALETVTGLIVSYSGFLEQADRHRTDAALRDGYLWYAEGTLSRDLDGILDRLDSLQDQQYDVLDGQVSFDRGAQLAWGATLLSAAALLLVLIETQVLLRRRFRRRYNLGLLGATATLLIALGGAVHVTAETQSALDAAGHSLRENLVSPWVPVTGDADTQRRGPAEDVSDSVQNTAREVDDAMSGTDAWEGLAGLVPVLGLLLAGQMARGLWPRFDEYRFRAR
ncbi:hypothetical protein [Streptomyces radicis]|uniref:hypothetical protein n=1 Tax=Streptomyces radicis TaxID=1750517 RepID=UPI001601AC3F|nr:hypothetical protein [Streptomyces radicis]